MRAKRHEGVCGSTQRQTGMQSAQHVSAAPGLEHRWRTLLAAPSKGHLPSSLLSSELPQSSSNIVYDTRWAHKHVRVGRDRRLCAPFSFPLANGAGLPLCLSQESNPGCGTSAENERALALARTQATSATCQDSPIPQAWASSAWKPLCV